jgi:cysteine desulfurase / selenocysteine lyase
MDIESIRLLFPVAKEHIFMNHAAESPKSTALFETVNKYLTDVFFGDLYEDRWIAHAEHVRRLAARLINAQPDEIAFVNNVSSGAMMIANGLSWKPKENMVTNCNQFPANVYPWLNLRRQQVDVRTPFLPRNDLAHEALFSSVDEKTRLIAISFVEYDNGFRYDLKRIGHFCRQNGILFFVDAVQGLGAMPVDVQSAEISFLATSGHKWLLGPSGQGFLYIHKPLLNDLYVLSTSWLSVEQPFDFYNYAQPQLHSAKRFEGGTSNLMGIAALGTGMELLLQTGIKAVSERILQLTEQLVHDLLLRGFLIDSCLEPACRSGIVAFRHPTMGTDQLFTKLSQNKVIISQRNGHIRVSPHFYNNEEELDRFIKILG